MSWQSSQDTLLRISKLEPTHLPTISEHKMQKQCDLVVVMGLSEQLAGTTGLVFHSSVVVSRVVHTLVFQSVRHRDSDPVTRHFHVWFKTRMLIPIKLSSHFEFENLDVFQSPVYGQQVHVTCRIFVKLSMCAQKKQTIQRCSNSVSHL